MARLMFQLSAYPSNQDGFAHTFSVSTHGAASRSEKKTQRTTNTTSRLIEHAIGARIRGDLHLAGLFEIPDGIQGTEL